MEKRACCLSRVWEEIKKLVQSEIEEELIDAIKDVDIKDIVKYCLEKEISRVTSETIKEIDIKPAVERAWKEALLEMNE